MFETFKLRCQIAEARRVELHLIKNADADRKKREATLEHLRQTLRTAEAHAAKIERLVAEAPARLAEIDRLENKLNAAA